MTESNTNMIWEEADWPISHRVRAGTTFRHQGVSNPPYQSLNLAMHVDDDSELVTQNRKYLLKQLNLPAMPVWLNQTHSNQWLNLDTNLQQFDADAVVTTCKKKVCAILTADCVPILIYDPVNNRIAAVHAGWKGICAGILDPVTHYFTQPEQLFVWIGPCISQRLYQVQRDVYNACLSYSSNTIAAFEKTDEEHWLCDLGGIVERLLTDLGIEQIYRSAYCTFTDKEQFFSYRRDGVTGRTASLIWME